MATLSDLVYVQAGSSFGNICNISVFSVNLVFYLVFSSLVIFTVYKIGLAILNTAQSDSSEIFEKLKENITDIVISIIGLLIISSALFFPKVILQTMGVDDAKNPFTNFGGCGTEDYVTTAASVSVGDFTYVPVYEPSPTTPPTPMPSAGGPAPSISPSQTPIPGPSVSPAPSPEEESITLQKSKSLMCSGTPSTNNQYNIVTFNIGGARETDHTNQSSNLVNFLTSPSDGGILDVDIIALQEIQPNLAAKLSSDLLTKYGDGNIYTYYVKHQTDSRNYGNMIISKYPLIDLQTYRINGSDGKFNRTLISSVVRTPTGDVRVFNIHTNAYSNPCNQLLQTYGYMRPYLEAGEKVVLLGDFNEQLRYVMGEEFKPECRAVGEKLGQFMNAECTLNECNHPAEQPTTVDHIIATDNIPINERCSKGNINGISDYHSLVGSTISL